MSLHFSNLDALLADPLIQKVMRADRVDPVRLRRDLDGVAVKLCAKKRPLDLSGARVHFSPQARRYFVGPLSPVSAGCENRLCC